MPKEIRELTIDPEFDALCRRLTPEEENFLFASLSIDGCRDPIITWANHDDTILDGRNRYRICRGEKIPFSVKALDLPDRKACIEWIVRNQLGRRNLSEEEKSYLRGKIYNERKKPAGAPAGNKNRTKVRPRHNVGVESTPTETADKLAEEFKVNPRTIERDGKFAEDVDTIAANVGEDAKQEIISGESDLTKNDVHTIADLPPKSQAKAIESAKKKAAKKAKKPELADRCLKLVEGLELLVARVDAIAKEQGGHVNHSKDLVRGIKDCINRVRVMERYWKGKR